MKPGAWVIAKGGLGGHTARPERGYVSVLALHWITEVWLREIGDMPSDSADSLTTYHAGPREDLKVLFTPAAAVVRGQRVR